ncbi:MAG: gluconate 2-dehydrogenase subunit 3 family protein [Vicinamibacterales bacterium]
MTRRDTASSSIDRRRMLKTLAVAPAAAAFTWTAGEVAEAATAAGLARRRAAQAGAAFQRQFFSDHEWETVRVLVDLVIPRDARSGSATEAGVPEFMDFMMIDQPNRQTAMRGGLAWLDAEANRRFDHTFAAATDAERRAILDDVAWPDRVAPGMSHGASFFASFRDLTASGFWTTRMGIDDLGYLGNVQVREWRGCPDEVLTRLGLPTGRE